MPAPPAIASFSAASTAVHAGESTTLVASFTGGAGSIARDVGAVRSGAAVTVTPTDDTTYTLTVTGGQLQVSVSQFGDFLCHSAQAGVTYGDAKMHAGGYPHVTFLFDGVESFGAGMGRVDIDLVYGGQEVQFEVPDVSPAAPVSVDWGPMSIELIVGGVSTPLTGVSAPADAPPAITVSTDACAADLAAASITIDGVSVAGR